MKKGSLGCGFSSFAQVRSFLLNPNYLRRFGDFADENKAETDGSKFAYAPRPPPIQEVKVEVHF